MQSTNTILMVKPSAFSFNEETALNNHFQKQVSHKQPSQIKTRAVSEFDLWFLHFKKMELR